RHPRGKVAAIAQHRLTVILAPELTPSGASSQDRGRQRMNFCPPVPAWHQVLSPSPSHNHHVLRLSLPISHPHAAQKCGIHSANGGCEITLALQPAQPPGSPPLRAG